MGIDESHFSVSFIVRGRSRKIVSTNHNFWRERAEVGSLARGVDLAANATLLG